MKINKLKLTNFENHPSTEVELGKVNIIVGPNGSGKSAIVNGISFATSSSLPTKPASDYIKKGTSEAAIEMEVKIGEDTKDTRKVIGSDGKVKTELMSTNAILSAIGTNSETARTLCDTWYFVDDADEKARRAVLSSVLTPKLDKNQILSAVAPHISEKYAKMNEEFVNDSFPSLDNPKKTQMEMLYKLSFDQRRDVKKDITCKEKEIKEVRDKLSAYKDTPSTIDKETLERTSEYDKTTTSIEYETKTLSKYNEEVENYEAKINELSKTEAELKEQLSEEMPEARVEAVKEKVNVLSSQVRGIELNIKQLQDNLGDKIRCPYFGSCRYENVFTDINDAVSNMKKEAKSKREELKDASKTLEDESQQYEVTKKISEISGMLEMANTKLQSMKNVAREKDTEIKETQAKADKLKEAGILTKEGLNAVANQTEIGKLKARISVYQEDAKKLEDTLDFLEAAVKLYSNRDIWTSLLSLNKDTFTSKLKEVVELLIPKYEVKIDDNMNLSFSNVSINTLSMSEKFRVGVGIQTALAIASGIGIVIADGSDIVADPSEFIDLINQLGAIDGIDTLIVASSRDFADSEVLKKDGVRTKLKVTASYFKVEEGVVTKQDDILSSWT